MKQGRFRKKPVVISAMQYDGKNFFEVVRWAESLGGSRFDFSYDDGNLIIKTLEGPMKAFPGHYIICGVAGEFYACDPEIFEQTYEEVSETDALVLNEAMYYIRLALALGIGEIALGMQKAFTPERVDMAAASRVVMLARMYDFVCKQDGRTYSSQELIDWAVKEVDRQMNELDVSDETDLDDFWKNALSNL